MSTVFRTESQLVLPVSTPSVPSMHFLQSSFRFVLSIALLPILELTFVLEGNTSPGHVLNTAKWSITNFSMTRLAQPCGPGRPVPSQITHSVPVSQGVWGDSPRLPTVLEPCDPCFYSCPFPICASSQAMAVPEVAFLFHLSNAALPASCSISFLFWSQWFQLTVAMHDILATHIHCFFFFIKITAHAKSITDNIIRIRIQHHGVGGPNWMVFRTVRQHP